MIRVYILLGVFLAGLGAGWQITAWYQGAQLADQLDRALREQKATYETELARRDKVLSEREIRRIEALRAAQTWRARYEQAKREDPECQAWAQSRLPDCAVKRLRALSADRADPPAPTGRPD